MNEHNTVPSMPESKEKHLQCLISALGGAAVAFSGGVDSSYLLSVCIDVLGAEKVIALTADSPLLPRAELATARQVAAMLGARHEVIAFDDLATPEVAANPPLRCYYCKRKRFETLLALVRRSGDYVLLHGENADDHLDYRPGSRAAQELGIRAPLAEVNMSKSDIRRLSRQRGLPTWNYPSAACLASRFPYNAPLTREGLERVEQAELLLEHLMPGRQLRVRDHLPVARIEVPLSEIEELVRPDVRAQVTQGLHKLGYRYVTLDLDGYRMGSLNADIES